MRERKHEGDYDPVTLDTLDDRQNANGKSTVKEPAVKIIIEGTAFIRSYIPPDYLIDGLLQRQFFYSLTGKTGGGRAAIALLFAVLIALGQTINGREFSRGRVLYLAGENPLDIQQRWIAMSQQLDFDGDAIDVHFIPGVFTVSRMADCIAKQVKSLGGVSLVIIDTTAAYSRATTKTTMCRPASTLVCNVVWSISWVVRPSWRFVILSRTPRTTICLPRGGVAYLNEVNGDTYGAEQQ